MSYFTAMNMFTFINLFLGLYDREVLVRVQQFWGVKKVTIDFVIKRFSMAKILFVLEFVGGKNCPKSLFPSGCSVPQEATPTAGTSSVTSDRNIA